MDLIAFLSDLAQNPINQLKFAENPAEMARAAGLAESVVEVLARRDSAQLQELLSTPNAGTSGHQAVVYSPERSAVIGADSAMIYSAETAVIYSAQAA